STNLMPSMSLGCGPQAGNITSDNITARHLINIKRVAFRRRDWETRYAQDHARAAAMSGDAAPRGSGLPGDPALAGARGPRHAESAAPASNWRGNPPVETREARTGAAPAAPMRPKAEATPVPTGARA